MKKLLAITACLLISACSTVKNMSLGEEVKPWEKDILAQEDMQIPSDDMFSYSDDHIYFSGSSPNGVGRLP